MKILTLRALVVAAAALAAAGVYAGEMHTPAFTVTLPGDFPEFQMKHDVQKSGENPVETTTWISRSPSTTEAFIVAVTTMPGKVGDAEKLFDKTRDALVASVKGTLDTDEKSPQTLPARRLTLHAPGAFIRARLMLSGNDLYQILYVARASEHLTSPDVAGLFASLHVIDRTPEAVSSVSK